MMNCRKKPNNLENNLLQYHFVHYEFLLNSPENEPGLCGEKLVSSV